MNKQKLLTLLLSGVMLSSVEDVVGMSSPDIAELRTPRYFFWENENNNQKLGEMIDELLQKGDVNIIIADTGTRYAAHFPNTIFIDPCFSRTSDAAIVLQKAGAYSKFIFVRSCFEDFWNDNNELLTQKLKGKVNCIILDWAFNTMAIKNQKRVIRDSIVTPEELIKLKDLLSANGHILVPLKFFRKFFDLNDTYKLGKTFDVIISKWDFRQQKYQDLVIDNFARFKPEAFTFVNSAWKEGINYALGLEESPDIRTKWGMDDIFDKIKKRLDKEEVYKKNLSDTIKKVDEVYRNNTVLTKIIDDFLKETCDEIKPLEIEQTMIEELSEKLKDSNQKRIGNNDTFLVLAYTSIIYNNLRESPEDVKKIIEELAAHNLPKEMPVHFIKDVMRSVLEEIYSDPKIYSQISTPEDKILRVFYTDEDDRKFFSLLTEDDISDHKVNVILTPKNQQTQTKTESDDKTMVVYTPPTK